MKEIRYNDLGRCALFLLFTFYFLLGTARAQAPAAPAGSTILIHTWQTAFKLPIKIDEAERQRLSAIQLFVRTGPGTPWYCHETVHPAQREFLFRVSQDGEYDFNMVLVEPSGRRTPADLGREAPELVVVVDTRPPECDVQLVTAPSTELMLRCDVRDANPDATRTRVEYQTAFGAWQPLGPHAEYPDCFRLPGPHVLRGKLRIAVADRAGNTTTRTVNAADLRILTSTDSAKLLAQVSSQSQKVPVSAAPTPPPGTIQQVSAAATVPATDTIANLQLVNRTHVALAYSLEDVGFHGVGKVEVWMTADRGETWQRIGDDPDRRSPVEFDLPGEGMYGVSLVVSNGSGYGGVPPSRGERPDWWVEVDSTKPQARLLELRPGTNRDDLGTYLITWTANRDDLGTYLITWTATDKNLRPQPIDLYYARRREGPWEPIAKGLQNTGSYRWAVPHGILAGTVYVSMQVTDLAGNTTFCELPQGVVVDLARPKARVLGVATSTDSWPSGN